MVLLNELLWQFSVRGITRLGAREACGLRLRQVRMAVNSMQTVKPRARCLYGYQWVVSGCDIHAFGTSLKWTLDLWYRCMLSAQTK
jgi:hypothetical protein